MNATQMIKAQVEEALDGTIFIMEDFFTPLIEYNTIKKIIQRLVKSKELIKIWNGLYQKPKFNQLVERFVPPSIDEIAQNYARKFGWKIIPAEDMALNILGLSTQVPNTNKYVSTGPSRQITANNKNIYFIHTSQAKIDAPYTSSLVFEALRYLGEENISTKHLQQIKKRLSKNEYTQLQKNAIYLREWMRSLIYSMEEL